MPPEFHLAVIMDGNGRWAVRQGLPRSLGHSRGVQTLNRLVKQCSDKGVSYLSVFAFSTENWKRSPAEVLALMKLIQMALNRYLNQLIKNEIQLCFLGDKTKLPPSLKKLCEEARARTRACKGMKLIVMLNYGGRWEIIQAFKNMVQKGKTLVSDVTEQTLTGHLPSQGVPPPNMIVRTGGVSRLSNFYLWQAAYSEFYVTEVLWPDFNDKELDKALQYYMRTERKFGQVPP